MKNILNGNMLLRKHLHKGLFWRFDDLGGEGLILQIGELYGKNIKNYRENLNNFGRMSQRFPPSLRKQPTVKCWVF